MVAVTDDTGDIVAEVDYTDNLDYWDGRNHTCGSTGRHKGLTQLPDGRFVLVHGSDWQGERNTAEFITAARAVQEILRSGNTDLFDDYPELAELREALPNDKGPRESRTFSVRVNAHALAEEVDEKIANLRASIDAWLRGE